MAVMEGVAVVEGSGGGVQQGAGVACGGAGLVDAAGGLGGGGCGEVDRAGVDGGEEDVEEKDRAPPEVLEQQATDDRSQCGAEYRHGAPDTDGDAALVLVVEGDADQ